MRVFLLVVLKVAWLTQARIVSSFGSFDSVAALNNHWGLIGRLPNSVEKARFLELNVTRIRTGMDWGKVEHHRGVYNWTFYDELSDELEDLGVAALWCVHPQNGVYPDKQLPTKEETIVAFARFYAAATERYGGRRSFFAAELSNEPNLKHDVNDTVGAWVDMALPAAQAARANARNADATLTGPAVASAKNVVSGGVTWYGEALKRAPSITQLLDIITVHTYRASEPESVGPTLAELQNMTDAAHGGAPGTAPLVAAGEWGYTSCHDCYRPVNQTVKGMYLAREWLVGHALGRPIAVWYEFYSGCSDETNRECEFGIVAYDSYQRLPAFYAAKAALAALRGMWAVSLDVAPIPGAHNDDDDTWDYQPSMWAVQYSATAPQQAAGSIAARPIDAAAVWAAVNSNSTGQQDLRGNVTLQLEAGRVYNVFNWQGEQTGTAKGPSVTIEAGGDPVYLRANDLQQ